MVTVDKAVIARLHTNGQVFEILVDCELALQLRAGKDVSMADVLADGKIFHEAKKGLVASEHKLKEIFGTDDTDAVAKEIIKRGEIQLTAEHREKAREEKRRRIIAYIHRNGADPSTHLPHPIKRIELAFEEAKIHIDEHKQEDKEIEEIIKKLRPILPIRFETKEIAVRIPAEFAGKVYGVIHQTAKPKSEEWLGNGDFSCIIEVSVGIEADLLEKLNNLCHGQVQSKVINIKG